MPSTSTVDKSASLVSLPILTEATKKKPSPENFVPVFAWNTKYVWVWVKQPSGAVLGPVQVPHSQISKKYKGKLGWVNQKVTLAGQIDPATYAGPKDIYSMEWEPGTPLPQGPPKDKDVLGVYSPPVEDVSHLPAGFLGTADKDPNGYELIKDKSTGETYSMLPGGKLGKWEKDEQKYYAVEKEDGEWGIHFDSPLFTAKQIKAGEHIQPETPAPPEPVKKVPEVETPEGFEAPPNYTITKVTPTYVLATTPAGVKVKWISITDHWVHADNPAKDHDPLASAAPKPKEAPKPETPKAVPSVPSEPTKTTKTPEDAPHLTKYTGNVDVNGLPLVDEVEEIESGEQLAKNLTLLPDERVAKWSSSGKVYTIFQYHPHHGYVYAYSGDQVTVDEAKVLMKALSLEVVNGRYHKVKKAGATPSVPPEYKAPLPNNCEAISQKDPNGLPMVMASPPDDDADEDEKHKLTLFPDGRLARWDKKSKKYHIWQWGSVMGFYNYYPSHPSIYVSLKEVKKLQAQVPAPVQTPKSVDIGDTIEDTGEKDDLGLSKYKVRPEYSKDTIVLSLLPNGEYAYRFTSWYLVGEFNVDTGQWGSAASKKTYTIDEVKAMIAGKAPVQKGTGELTPTNEKDANGYTVGEAPNGFTYTMLPGYMVGIWKPASGAYSIYKYDGETNSYYNSGELWAPPGKHASAASYPLTGTVDLAQLIDTDETTVIILPNGKFAVYVGDDKFEYYKVAFDDRVFVGTGEHVAKVDVYQMSQNAAYKSVKPTGTVDANGLPQFAVKAGYSDSGSEMVLLPNGKFAKPESLHKNETDLYHEMEFDGDEKEWWGSEPEKIYTIDDIKAMDTSPESVTPTQGSTASIGGSGDPLSTLTPLDSEDPNGFPMYSHSSMIVNVSVLPDGQVGIWRPHGPYYQKVVYNPAIPGWEGANPTKHITLADIKGAPEVAPESAAISDPKTTLVPAGSTDLHGYPEYTHHSLFKDVVILPTGDVGSWSDMTQSYVKMSYIADDDTWEVQMPAQYVTVDDVEQFEAKQSTFESATTKDALGLTVYKIKPLHQGGHFDEVVRLPNGMYASSTPDLYTVVYYNQHTEKWSGVFDNAIQYTVADVAKMLGVAAPTAEPVAAAAPASAQKVAVPAPGHPSLKPLNMNDDQGFPVYEVIEDAGQKGTKLMWLPTGEWAKWNENSQTYYVKEYDASYQYWLTVEPEIQYDLSDIAQMKKDYNFVSTVHIPAHETLDSTGQKDDLGLLIYKIKEGYGLPKKGKKTIVALPDADVLMKAFGSPNVPKWAYAYKSQGENKYRGIYYDAAEEGWRRIKPMISYTADKLKTAIHHYGQAATPQVAPPHDSLISTGQSDEHGMPTFEVKGANVSAGMKLSKLPNGELAMLIGSGGYQSYKVYVPDEVDGEEFWTPKSPSVLYQVDAAKALKPSEAQPVASGSASLDYTNTTNTLGLKLYRVKAGYEQAGEVLAQLPDGRMAQYDGTAQSYDIVVFDETDVKWTYIDPPEYLPVSDVEEMVKVNPQPYEGEHLSLKLTGETDSNGLPIYKVKDGYSNAGDESVRLPNGLQAASYEADSGLVYGVIVFSVNADKWVLSSPVKKYTTAEVQAMKSGDPGTTAHASLESTGEKDELGLPTFKVKPGHGFGGVLSALPNGEYAQHLELLDQYVVFAYAHGEWATSSDKDYTTDEVKAMIIVHGLHPSLKPLNKVDDNGVPLFKDQGGYQLEYGVLPDGAVVQYAETGHYIKAEYSDWDQAWKEADPIKIYTVDQVKAMLSAVVTAPSFASGDPALDSLEATGSVDAHGLPTFNVKPGFGFTSGHPLARLPNGKFARWLQPLGLYRVVKFGVEGWKFSLPSEKYTPEEVASMGEQPVGGVQSPSTAQQAAPVKKLPELKNLNHLGSGDQLGYEGAGDKEIFEDPETGKKYIFKVAETKDYPKKPEPFKIPSQVGFSDIAALVRPDGHVRVEEAKFKGKKGTIQEELELSSETKHLKYVGPTALNEQQKLDVAAEHMLDWLMSQHDSHGGNLIVTKEGRVVGIDKEQGWKYVDHPKFQQHKDRLALDYKPNSEIYGEQEPFYNKFWRSFKDGEIDFDPVKLNETLKRIEDIEPGKYGGVLDSYIGTLEHMKGPKKEYDRYAFKKKMISRKATFRADFENFITELYTEREDKPGKFTFKQGWVPEGAEGDTQYEEITQSARMWALKELGGTAIKTHNDFPEELMLVRTGKHDPITKVQAFLDSMGVSAATTLPDGSPIPMNPIMGSAYNSIIVKVSDMEKIVTKTIEITKDPDEQFADHAGVPTYHAHVLAPLDSPGNVEGLKQAHQMRLGPLGKDFTLDADAVEQQTASVQRVIDLEGNPFMVVHFKLRKHYWQPLESEGVSGTYEWPLGAYDSEKDALVMSGHQSSAYSQPARIFKVGSNELAVMVSNAKFTFRGSVYATIRGPSPDVKVRLAALMDKTGLTNKVMKDPTTEDVEKYNLMQALWCLAPQKHKNVDEDDISVDVLKTKLQGVLTKKQIDSIRQVKGTVGRGSPMIPGLWRKLGGGSEDDPVLKFVLWSVSTSSVPKILKSAATGIHERARLGLGAGDTGGPGTSESSDINTGGADCTTMRIATKQGLESGTGLKIGSVSRDVALIIAPEVCDRLDMHFSHTDSFGCCNPNHGSNGSIFKNRKGLGEAIKKFDNSGYHSGSAEIVIRRGVPPTMIKRICVSDESDRKEVLKYCIEADIKQHNGCPIEDFVVVESTQKGAYDKYLKPLGY